MRCREVKFTAHSVQRMFERGISHSQVLEIVEKGEVIKEYPEDKPYPGVLILGFVEGRPIHVVVGKDDQNGICYIVTVYEPDPTIWGEDFKERGNK